jgi:hypothetical protein
MSVKKKPFGWCSTKPSPHQLYMLKMFDKGWVFNLYNKRPGSWNTYWVLLRKGWCENHPNRNRLTTLGKAVLEYYGNELTPMEAYYKEAMTR